MLKAQGRPQLVHAPIYHFRPEPHWKQFAHQERYWSCFEWGWCNLKETVSLINKQYGLRWTREEFLRRFAIPKEKGLVRKGSSYVPDLITLDNDDGVEDAMPYFVEHTSTDYHFLDDYHHPIYIPAGWVKDILWALYHGCTQTILEDGKKVACLEDGTPVFFMTGAGKCH